MATRNWNKAPASMLLEHMKNLLEDGAVGKLFEHVDVFEDQVQALETLGSVGDDIEDEDDVATLIGDLDVAAEIKTLEVALVQLQSYQKLLKDNHKRIVEHVVDDLVQCPNCGGHFNRNMV